MMKISKFTQENSLSRPSIEYYSFRHLPYEQHQAVQIIYAMFYQLQALPHCSDDINVVRHKTLFWLSQIQEAYKGAPSHPLAQDLQQLLREFSLPQKEWIMILTAIEMQTDGLLLENQEEFEQYADRLYGCLYRLLMVIFHTDAPINQLARARTILSFIQQPDQKGVRFLLSENADTQVIALFGQAAIGLVSCKSLKILARLYQSQAKQPMIHLAPLKLLWLSIRERLSS
jgi:hypothetical protein